MVKKLKIGLCHFTDKRCMRLFLGIEYGKEKNIDFVHIQTLSLISHLEHPLEN
jgi:hypothetical protein